MVAYSCKIRNHLQPYGLKRREKKKEKEEGAKPK